MEEHGEFPSLGTKLYNWSAKIRVSMNGSGKFILTKYHINELNSIGFIWDLHHEVWESNFLRYSETFKDGNYPKYLEEIGLWASSQRKSFSKGKLLQYRIDKLNSIGFVWNAQDRTWQKGYEELLKYKVQFGDCKVNHLYEIVGFKLGNWVGAQRSEFKRGKLPRDRIEALNSLGFKWDLLDAMWKSVYDALLRYKEQFGNCKVPKRFEIDGLGLGRWMSRVRNGFKKGNLSQCRIDQLNAIGFEWEISSGRKKPKTSN